MFALKAINMFHQCVHTEGEVDWPSSPRWELLTSYRYYITLSPWIIVQEFLAYGTKLNAYIAK